MRCPDDSTGNISSHAAATPPVRSAFAYAAKLAFAYGPLVNVINGPWDVQHEWETEAQRITQQAVEVYNALPPDMQWSAYKCVSIALVRLHVNFAYTIAFRNSRTRIKAQYSFKCIYGCTPYWWARFQESRC